jgi:hypothetical protein
MSNIPKPVIEWLRNATCPELFEALRASRSEEDLEDLAFAIDPLSQAYLERC